MKNIHSSFSEIKENISEQKNQLRSESCRDYDIKCQNFWEIHRVDSEGERLDGEYIQEFEGPITKKKILSAIEGISNVEFISICGNAYSLDKDLPVGERWEYADPFDGWSVEISVK